MSSELNVLLGGGSAGRDGSLGCDLEGCMSLTCSHPLLTTTAEELSSATAVSALETANYSLEPLKLRAHLNSSSKL